MISTAEKIETIVDCFLRSRTTSGTFGTLTEVPAMPEFNSPSCYRVETDGKTFMVRCDAIGWRVQFGPIVGHDPDLYLAAKFAIETRWPGNVSSVEEAFAH